MPVASGGLAMDHHEGDMTTRVGTNQNNSVHRPSRHPVIVREPVMEPHFSPSAYLAEMSMTTAERFIHLNSVVRPPKIIEFLNMPVTSHNKTTHVNVDEALFQPYPSELIFQSFDPFETYSVSLMFRNSDHVARRIKVLNPESPLFSISCHQAGGNGVKLAPGIEGQFTVTFTPEERKDYSYELVCITEREKFVVPIRAIGARAILDFPNEINFDMCAVKYTSSRNLLVRNVGNRIAKFFVEASAPFAVVPPKGNLDIGSSMQIDVTFTPLKIGTYSDELVLRYDTGEKVYIAVSGGAEDANIRLEKSTLWMDDTYMLLSSQRTVKLNNRSNIMVNFEWRQFATEFEEMAEKHRTYEILIHEEMNERDEFNDLCLVDPSQQERLSILNRRFRNKTKAIENDRRLHHDDIYSIEPMSGVIWPNSQIEMTIVFRPQRAIYYPAKVYCDISGREMRLPLTLKGSGMGPRARFSFDELDIGSVFVNSLHKYEVVLENRGHIPAPFRLLQNKSLFGPKFQFIPMSDTLGVGEQQSVQIHFCSNELGEFLEDFEWELEGSEVHLSIRIHGHVIGPTFDFDLSNINFGIVSYGFVNSETVSIHNTSQISMQFSLRVPSDEARNQREFTLIPSSGVIRPQSEQSIIVEFFSQTVKTYDIFLVVDVEGIGEDLLLLPITAQCIVPQITLATPLLNFNKCFLLHSYTQDIELINTSDQPARYSLLPQEDIEENTLETGLNYTDAGPSAKVNLPLLYTADVPEGVIWPQSTLKVSIHGTIQELGQHTIPVRFRIAGSSDEPLEVSLSADGIGPIVAVSADSIEWGRTPVLRDVLKTITLSNSSLIPAEFNCSLALGKRSVFQVTPQSGTISPNRTVTLTVVAHLDDVIKYSDKLAISVVNGQKHLLPLLARGFGTTIFCQDDLTTIDFAHNFSNRLCSRSFLLENRGRRAQSLSWVVESNKKRPSTKSSVGSNAGAGRRVSNFNAPGIGDIAAHASNPIEPEYLPVFKVSPEKFVLESGASQLITISGQISQAMRVSEHLICSAIIGKQTNQREQILSSVVTADFIDPLVKLSDTHLFFIYSYDGESETGLEIQTRRLELTNISELPLNMIINCKSPFSVVGNICGLYLSPMDSASLTLQFDPSYKPDRFSKCEKGHLVVSYDQHPQKDSVELIAEVRFPNLTFSTYSLDFGCQLNDTELTQAMTLTNDSSLEVHYWWCLTPPNCIEKDDDNTLTGDEMAMKLAQVFDILPLRSTLLPGQSEEVIFTFYAHADCRFSALAQCHVSGGPSYDICLTGEASTMRYSLDTHHVDFGMQMFGHVAETNINLSNIGSVGFDFEIMPFRNTLTTVGLDSVVSIFPLSGHIIPFSKQRIVVRFSPSIPECFRAVFEMHVAHFESEIITVVGKGVFTRITLALPRLNDEAFTENLVRARKSLKDQYLKKQDLDPADSSSICTGATSRRPAVTLASLIGKEHEITVATEVRMTKSGDPTNMKAEDNYLDEEAFNEEEVLAEAERLVVKDFSLAQLVNGNDASRSLFAGLGTNEGPVASPNTMSALPNSKSLSPTRGITQVKKVSNSPVVPRAILAHYICDFGNVVRQMISRKVIMMTNSGHHAVSFNIDKYFIASTGFSVDPERVKSLPAGETMELCVCFQTRNVAIGSMECLLPVDVYGGPKLIVTLRANVVVPCVAIIPPPPDPIQFGQVLCGQCKVITIQIHNTEAVSCSWTARLVVPTKPKNIGASNEDSPPSTNIRLSPSAGHLHPNQRSNIAITFTPTEEGTFSSQVAFKVDKNPRSMFMNITGEGMESKIEFSPQVLELGPVLPFTAGDERTVTVMNHTNVDVEIYSLEFDSQYIEEEEVLRHTDGFKGRLLLLPPRATGDQLPREILDAYVPKKGNLKNSNVLDGAAESPCASHGPSHGGSRAASRTSAHEVEHHDMLTNHEPIDVSNGLDDTDRNGDSQSGVGELVTNPAAAALARYIATVTGDVPVIAAKVDHSINVIIYGPPLSGKSTQAKAIAASHGITIISLDETIRELIKSERPGDASLSVAVRDALNAAHEISIGSNIPTATGGPSHHSHHSNVANQQTMNTASDCLSVQELAYPLPLSLLSEVFAARLKCNDCKRGVIIDGLECIFATNANIAAQAVLRAFDPVKKVHVVLLKVNSAEIESRNALIQQEAETQAQEQALLHNIPNISEEDYDALSEIEREEYDRACKAFVRRLRDEELRQLEEERREAERLAAELSMQQDAAQSGKNKRGSSNISSSGGGSMAVPSTILGGNGQSSNTLNVSSSGGATSANLLNRKVSSMVQGSSKPTGREKNVRRANSPDDDVPAGNKVLRSGNSNLEKMVENQKTRRNTRTTTQENSGMHAASAERTGICYLARRMSEYEATLDGIVGLFKHWGNNGISDGEAGDIGEEHGINAAGTFSKKLSDSGIPLNTSLGGLASLSSFVKKGSTIAIVASTNAVSSDGDEGGDDDADNDTPRPPVSICVDGANEPSIVTSMISDDLPLASVIDIDSPASLIIPMPITYQLVAYPRYRGDPEPIDYFTLYRNSTADHLADEEEDELGTMVISQASKDQLSDSRSGKTSRLRKVSSKATVQEKSSSSAAVSSTIAPADEPLKIDESEEGMKRSPYRWVIPANSSIDLTAKFSSNRVGHFDRHLSFETVVGQRTFQFYCRGICEFPQISTDWRHVFPNRVKAKINDDQILCKQFVLSTQTFEFGPLLCGKSRDKYKEGKQPENMSKFNVINPSHLNATVDLCFQHDQSANTFILSPSTLHLGPSESAEVSIWAYPKTVGEFRDTLICSIKDNPEPVLIDMCCHGVRPELELDKRQLSFDRLLLHRKDRKSFILKNPTRLPVAWKLLGTDALGEEFSVAPISGTIEPYQECIVTAVFKAIKPVFVKKPLRLEVSDVDKLGGVLQTENMYVNAEAYDAALDVHFPKGCDGGFEFGVLKVYEEVKHNCTLKNKGKYEIGFKFVFDKVVDVDLQQDLFTVSPQQGVLLPNDKPVSVQVAVRATKGLTLQDFPYLKCQVIEPMTGEIIASIPVKVSVRTVFSQYSIHPIRDINFGAMVINTKKTRTFTIENKGEFEFKYNTFKMIEPVDVEKRSSGAASHARPLSRQSAKGKQRKVEPPTAAVNKSEQAKLSLGMFTIQPAFGTVTPGSSTTVTVDCYAELPGRCIESIGIDISDRQPDDSNILRYKIFSEACVPGINTSDMHSVFEEHALCHHLDLFNAQRNVYAQEERVFMFGPVITGQNESARFKISNPFKVPCDVVVLAKPRSKAVSPSATFAFDVEPKKLSIRAHEHAYVTVSFSPVIMHTYSGIFEALVENTAPNSKCRLLSFELRGEGTLPRVAVVKPTLRPGSKSAMTPTMSFRRMLLGRSHTMDLVLLNEGIIPATVTLQLRSPLSSEGVSSTAEPRAFSCGSNGVPCVVHPKETTTFHVNFHPSEVQKYEAELVIVIEDNEFEEVTVLLAGEGYMDNVTLDGISGDIDNLLQFGDCGVGQTETIIFAIANHSTDTIRFSWPSNIPDFTFSPCVGHVPSNSSKDIYATFRAVAPVEHTDTRLTGRVSRITLNNAIASPGSWDDSVKSVRWTIEEPGALASSASKVIESEPEPLHEILEENLLDLDLRANAIADFARIECKTKDVPFRDTLMFQSRAYSFIVSNTGKVRVPYQWRTLFIDPTREESGNDIMDWNPPFSINPDVGTIEAGTTATFKVTFSPSGVYEYRQEIEMMLLLSSIPAVTGDTPTGTVQTTAWPRVLFRGRSLRPFCHFEIDSSDYASSGRRNPELRGPGGQPGASLDPDTRVIEFSSCGIKVRNTRRFYIVNPTSTTYRFRWECDAALLGSTALNSVSSNNNDLVVQNVNDATAPINNDFGSGAAALWGGRVFRCLTPKGTVVSGKKFEVVFEYTPDTLDLVESFWHFIIEEHGVSVPFLLVGHANEPNVYMDRPSINFKALLLDHEAKDTVMLVNKEVIPFSFSFNEKSFHSEGLGASLSVTPVSGTIPSESSIPIKIAFTPVTEAELNFNLICNIKRKPTPVTLNVKGEGYAIRDSIISETVDGTVVELVSNLMNVLDFGEVQINEKSIQQVTIMNSGKFNFDFNWKSLPVDNRKQSTDGIVSVSPDTGTVLKGQRLLCTIVFHPKSPISLRHHKLICKIMNGHTYPILVSGTGVQPLLNFSFLQHDFGQCFVYRPGMPLQQTVLRILNDDSREISLDCLYENTSHLEVSAPSINLEPGQIANVPVVFYPRDLGPYRETVTFEINGLSKINVNFFGEGVELKVELLKQSMQVVNFGALRIGHVVVRKVKIVNRSVMPVTFELGREGAIEALAKKNVTIEPNGPVTLRPKGVLGVELRFMPDSRIPIFSEEIFLECNGLVRPLFTVGGSCQGIDIRLENDNVPFGAVVQKSRSTRRLMLHNMGDIGAKFRWNLKQFGPDFSILPSEGYISPGMEVSFEVSFHPQELNQDIRYEGLVCQIEGASVMPTLTLTGMCVLQPAQAEFIKFSTQVRQKEVRTIQLTNRTLSRWVLRPFIENDAWIGSETVTVDVGQTKAYELVYQPLTMTTADNRHVGSVFFPLPDGTGLLYNLHGTAEPPKPAGTITREVPCKTSYTELITISNWLKRPQRFKAVVEVTRPDPSTSLKGLDYIDVPGLLTREYKLSFYAYKEGVTNAKVVFRNEQTNEYLFYNIVIKATPPGVISTINLTTPVRQSLMHTITIDNPLTTPVACTTTCTSAEILVPHSFTIPSRAEGQCILECLPLKVGDTLARLTVQSAELGIYQYDLHFNATAPIPERGMHFKVGIGGLQVQTFRFLHYGKAKTEYTCKVDNHDFAVDKSITASAATSGGTEVNVDVTYEPSKLGDTRTMLLVSSTGGGEYTCPLFGHCVAPKPQGPFIIKAGSSTAIPFKNVFAQSTLFHFAVDHAAFQIKATETIASKKTHNLQVSYKSTAKVSRMGKLVVSCPQSTDPIATSCAWIFYLKGVTQ